MTVTSWKIGEGEQFICDPSMPCGCNPANPDACDCDASPDISRKCSKCGAGMVLIRTDDGEPVEAAS